MDRQSEAKVMEAINQFAVTNYVQHLLVVRYLKLTLFSSLPFSGTANISDAHNILLIKEFPALYKLFGRNANN